MVGKNGSSDNTQDDDNRGYRMLPNRFPNELLSSLRNAPVTKSRFLYPSRSSMKRPIVTVSCVVSLSVWITPPASEFVPAVSFWTRATTPCRRWGLYRKPPVVVEVSVGV